MQDQQYKRNIAYKYRIGTLLTGKPLFDGEKLKALEIENRPVSRINLIANITDKYVQDGEKKFASITLDDGSGQIKAKVFGDDLDKVQALNQGDTVVVIGLLRSWNNEVYLTPEIIKKKDTSYLLLRKLEIESSMPKSLDKSKISELKDKLLAMIKDSESQGGIDIDKIILELKEHPDVINQEIKKLLEDGVAYEPRPGKLRFLG